MASTTHTKWVTPSFLATIVGWALTISIFIWHFSANHAAMEYRIQSLEEKNTALEERMKDADALRNTIQPQLAEIKTDLIWIRNELSTRKDD